MKTTCPHCGTYGPAELFMTDDDAKTVVITVAKLPDAMHRIIWTYLGLFRKPGANRVLTWSRVERIVGELSALMNDPETQWKGQRVVPNSPQFWVDAMRSVIDRDAHGKLERPLDGHNYLRAIAYELAEKAWHQGNVTREKQAQHRPVPVRQDQKSRNEETTPTPMGRALEGWKERLGFTEE